MTGSIAQSSRPTGIKGTTVSLRIVLNQFQSVFFTNIANGRSIGTTSVQVNYHHRTCSESNSLFNECIVNLQRIDIWLNKDRNQPVFRNSQNGSYIGVSRHDDLVAITQNTHFPIGTKDKRQCVKTVSHTNTMACANIVGIVLFKTTGSLSIQIPATAQHLVCSMYKGGVNSL